MPIKQESLQTELRDLLKSKGYRVTNKNSSGDTVPVPEEADVFQFEFKKDGKGLYYVCLCSTCSENKGQFLEDSKNDIIYDKFFYIKIFQSIFRL